MSRLKEYQEYYTQQAKEKSQKVAEERENRGNFSYEEYLYSAFEKTGQTKIIRFTENSIVTCEDDYNKIDPLGNKTNNKYSSKIVNLVTGFSDKGNKFLAYVPFKKEAPGHFFWRMYDLIMKKEWKDDPKNPDKKIGIPIYENVYPELYDRFATNGRAYNISKNPYDKGLRPQRIIVGNVIDREMMDKHRELKHTALLSKNVNEKDGKFYYDRGIPAFGFYKLLLDKIMSSYGPLSFFDVALTRIGETQRCWEVLNATKFKQSNLLPEIPADLHDFISINEELTDEEKSWEQYDIIQMTKPSLELKWVNKIPDVINMIDKAFKTHFFDELKEKADAQKKEFDEQNKNNNSVQVQGAELETSKEAEKKVTEEPIRSRRRSSAPTDTPSTWNTLKSNGFVGDEFWNEKVEVMIETIDSKGNIIWKSDYNSSLAGCEDETCDFESPEVDELKGCLKCGFKFSV